MCNLSFYINSARARVYGGVSFETKTSYKLRVGTPFVGNDGSIKPYEVRIAGVYVNDSYVKIAVKKCVTSLVGLIKEVREKLD